MKVVILAAGLGSRLNSQTPKPLSVLANGKTILQSQIDIILQNGIDNKDIILVVGHAKDQILSAFPYLVSVENVRYNETNTSKSLLLALHQIKENDVIWMNGDVVMENEVFKRILHTSDTCMAVNSNPVAEEEVKYSLTSRGTIGKVSKAVTDPVGEAVGINKVTSTDLDILINSLERCMDTDYFERGLEFVLEQGIDIFPVDVSDLFCMEIDFPEDMEKVNELITENTLASVKG